MKGQMNLFSLGGINTCEPPSEKKKKSTVKKAEKDKQVSAVEELIKKYNGHAFEDCISVTSKDFESFCRKLKNALKKDALAMGFTDVTLTKGHYYLSGFLNRDDQYVYYSFSVERGETPTYLDKNDCMHAFLYRTAKDDKDFSGGANHFCRLSELLVKTKELMDKDVSEKYVYYHQNLGEDAMLHGGRTLQILEKRGYVLTLDKYREIERGETNGRSPKEIMMKFYMNSHYSTPLSVGDLLEIKNKSGSKFYYYNGLKIDDIVEIDIKRAA